MGVKKLFVFLILLASLLFPGRCFAQGGDSPEPDPLVRLNYRMAFDNSRTRERFQELMHRLGCAQNVFGQVLPDGAVAVNVDGDDSDRELLLAGASHEREAGNFQDLRRDKQIYEKACLARLYGARRWAITENAREALTTMVLISGAAVTTSSVLPPDSLGGSFGIFAVVFNAAYLLRPALRSCYNLAVMPAHPLNKLEERYAIAQCFIPRALWGIIEEKFMFARQNQFQQRTSMDFIEFALGLTTYKPLPALRISRGALAENIQRLFEKIDSFFNDYADMSGENLWALKNNISKFILSFLGDRTQSPRYLYFHGPGGIGKTYFVDQLRRWIEEIIPNSVQFENLIVASSEELEGSQDRPGSMLCVLRNQLRAHKRGSVVFMDEATWLNKADTVSAAKRVFNGDQSQISTSYFGGGVDGAGVDLKIPPMLIVVASNDEIKDPALKTRFDTIHFPIPKREKLLGYAREIAAQSRLVRDRGIDLDGFDFARWLDDSGANNFRDVASHVVPAILSSRP